MHYYQPDLALIHDRGYGFHGDRCAPGIVDLLAPVRDGLILELGCGSGALTRHLLAAGLRVVATDASPDMLALARSALAPRSAPGPEADLWALGATLFQAVDGRSPFLRDTVTETMYAIAMEPPPEVRGAGPLTPLIQGLLIGNPADPVRFFRGGSWENAYVIVARLIWDYFSR